MGVLRTARLRVRAWVAVAWEGTVEAVLLEHVAKRAAGVRVRVLVLGGAGALALVRVNCAPKRKAGSGCKVLVETL